MQIIQPKTLYAASNVTQRSRTDDVGEKGDAKATLTRKVFAGIKKDKPDGLVREQTPTIECFIS